MRINGDFNKIMGVYNQNKSINKTIENKNLKGKKDIVSISDDAKDFQTALREAKKAKDVREEKVAKLSKEYAEGTYNVSTKEIAEKMVNSFLKKNI
jgi:negative regulator of flagellin synthesis FlgM